jgi:serine/threonine protein kinase
MNPERWQQIERLYHEALQRKPDKRGAFLDEACGDDQALRRQIELLLTHEREAENFIEVPALAVAARSMTTRETGLVEGQIFGPYRIQARLGAGGMGEVYKARDTRLDRPVAIKILLPNSSARPDLRERFRREARAIANLNHPNICVIHDVGQQDGLDYLVMEHLEGDTLAHRLERGKLAVGDVVKIALEMTDALVKVHRQGVVHRDLKPGNIMLTTSGAKLLDFGLAKLAPNRAAELAALPDTDITVEGTILGTLRYMAPEQLQAKEADERSDIFSLGTIVYEMLTGRKAFDGKNPASVIAAILEREPEPIPATHDRKVRGLDYVLRRCIAKNPEDRWQTAHDLLLQLRWIVQEDDTPISVSTSRARPSATSVKPVLLIGALAIIIVAAVLVAVRTIERPADGGLVRFPIYPPQDRFLSSPAYVSPDGRTVAYMTRDEKGDRVVWVRSVDSVDAKPLPGAADAVDPFFWSPDSKQLGFATQTHLKRIPLTDSQAQTLTEVRGVGSGAWGGGAWAADGTILFTPGPDQPLFRIAEQGGTPSPVTTLDKSRDEVGHFWPQFLPDGKHFLYLARSRNAEKTAVWVGQLGSNDRTKILDENTLASYAHPGYLLFVRGENLFAQPFDAERLELSGDATVLASGLQGAGWYSVSQAGVLTVNANPNPRKSQLYWFGRKGEELGSFPSVIAHLATFYTPVISPDGREIAIERHVPRVGFNIWLLDAQHDRPVRFTLQAPQDERAIFGSDGRFISGPHDQTPIWSPDGKLIAFSTEVLPKGWIIRQKRLDSQAETVDLATLTGESYTDDWSKDGKLIAYESFDQQTRWDIWLLPVAPAGPPKPLLNSSFNERQLQFSFDSHWIAYISNQSGRNEVYVQKYPATGEKVQQISTNGGVQPRWSRDGREIFYIAPGQKLMSVEIKTTPRFEAGPPSELFQLRLEDQSLDTHRNHYDVSADGQRFLIKTFAGEPDSAVIHVLLNWTAALKRQ